MDPWIVIERTTVPGNDTELTLWRRDDDFAIRLAGVPGDLMNSRGIIPRKRWPNSPAPDSARTTMRAYWSVVSAWDSRWGRCCAACRARPR